MTGIRSWNQRRGDSSLRQHGAFFDAIGRKRASAAGRSAGLARALAGGLLAEPALNRRPLHTDALLSFRYNADDRRGLGARVAVSSGLEEVERLVAQLEDALDGEGREKDARAILRAVLLARLPNPPESGSVADAIEALSAQGNAQQSLESATLLRCLARDPVVSSTREASIERHVVTIVERSLPEVVSLSGVAQKRQTFEKYEILKTIHGRTEESLAPFLALSADIDVILGARQILARTLKHSIIENLLRIVSFGSIPCRIRSYKQQVSTPSQGRSQPAYKCHGLQAGDCGSGNLLRGSF